jgi:multiple sugar transport system permease protein
VSRAGWPGIVGRHAVLALTAGFCLAPFVWMLSLSIKPPGEVFDGSFRLWPQTFYALENYTRALTVVPVARFMLNGAIVCIAIFAFQVAIALPCAYALAKLRFAGRDSLFALVLVGLLIPPQVLAIPLFVMFSTLGMLDSYAALIVPWTISVFGIFLLRQFFRTVPDDLIHAARLDGLSEFAIAWRIMLPTATPALIAFGIFSLVAHWNDLFWPLIALQSEDLATPPLGAMYFRNEETGNDYGPLMAGVVIITAPLVVVFLAAQRWFIDGVTMTSVK